MTSLSLNSIWNNILPNIDNNKNFNHSRELIFGNFNVNFDSSHNPFTKFEPNFSNWQVETNRLIIEETGLNGNSTALALETASNVDGLIEAVKKIKTDLHRCAKYTECFFEANNSMNTFCGGGGGDGSGGGDSAVTTLSPNKWKNPKLYKTALCDYWNNKKRCKYGIKCWFAHGINELRYVLPQENFNNININTNNNNNNNTNNINSLNSSIC